MRRILVSSAAKLLTGFCLRISVRTATSPSLRCSKKFATEFNIDSILNGELVPEDGSFSMNFVLHDLAGKELFRISYSEPYNAQTVGLFPAVLSTSGWPFFLPGYDGVSFPRAIRMQNPRYSEHARNAHVAGIIMVSNAGHHRWESRAGSGRPGAGSRDGQNLSGYRQDLAIRARKSS
jgi:hypothetical protein